MIVFNNLKYIILFGVLSCNSQTKKIEDYLNHIGDTNFNSKIDDPNFKFCDSTKIYHSRSRISYKNGSKGLQNELIDGYNFQYSFKNFTGYFFIRLAVNCKNETGRFRWEIVDENHAKTNCPEKLESHIIQLIKNLKNWNGVIHNDKKYDGYTFFIIKFKNGKIVDL